MKKINTSQIFKNLQITLKYVICLLMLTFGKIATAQVYPNIASFATLGTPVHGLKIKTNLPFIASYEMTSMEIIGYSYGKNLPLNLHLCFYIYKNTAGTPIVYKPVISSSGAHTPDIKIANEGGKVVVFFADKIYAQRLFVNGFSGLNRVNDYKGWTIVDEPLTGSGVTNADYRNNFRGEIILPGGKWSSNGNLGIGTTTPMERLSVNGNIRAHQVKVEMTGWPDYVFEESYQLPSLKETEDFVKLNKHLPGVPTAKEIEEDGLSLGEMNKILMQKVEELTLHLIDKEKEINTQGSRIQKLEVLVNNLIK